MSTAMVYARSGSGVAKEGFNSQSQRLEIWHEKFAMHELDDRPELVRARARAPRTEDVACGFEHAEVNVHVAAAERLDELLGGRE
jgi:hypothetical protein